MSPVRTLLRPHLSALHRQLTVPSRGPSIFSHLDRGWKRLTSDIRSTCAARRHGQTAIQLTRGKWTSDHSARSSYLAELPTSRTRIYPAPPASRGSSHSAMGSDSTSQGVRWVRRRRLPSSSFALPHAEERKRR